MKPEGGCKHNSTQQQQDDVHNVQDAASSPHTTLKWSKVALYARLWRSSDSRMTPGGMQMPHKPTYPIRLPQPLRSCGGSQVTCTFKVSDCWCQKRNVFCLHHTSWWVDQARSCQCIGSTAAQLTRLYCSCKLAMLQALHLPPNTSWTAWPVIPAPARYDPHHHNQRPGLSVLRVSLQQMPCSWPVWLGLLQKELLGLVSVPGPCQPWEQHCGYNVEIPWHPCRRERGCWMLFMCWMCA